MKNLLKKIIALIFVVCLFGGVFYGCNGLNSADEEYSYVSMRINPEVELVVDENNIIVSVNPLNQDAEVLLADTAITGTTLEAGSELIVQLATEAGYINVDSYNEVFIDVVTDDDDDDAQEETKADKIAKSMQDRIAKFFDNNGIFGKVSKETLAEYLTEAQELNVSPGKLKLMMRALDLNPDLNLEEVKDMEVKDIIALIKDTVKNQNLGYTAREQFKTAREELRTRYQNMFALEEEIETLEKQLEGFTGSDEEKSLIEADLTTKEQEYKTLQEQYKDELETLSKEYKAMAEEIKETRKSEMEQRKQEHKQKIEEHKQRFKQRAQSVMNQIEAIKDEFEVDNEALEVKYEQINEIKKDIWTLRIQLMDFDLAEEQTTQIKVDLGTKQDELASLQSQYQQELNTIMEAYKQKMSDLQQQNV